TVAKHLRLENHQIVIDRRTFLDMLPDAVRAADEPLADPTIVPLLAVSRLARQHVKVALSGEGSDEILAGYQFENTYRKFRAARYVQQLPSPLLLWLSRMLRWASEKSAATLADVAITPLSKWNLAHRNTMT